MAMFFCKQQFDFVHKTTIEKFQKPKHSKKYVFMAKCMYWKCGVKRKILPTKAREMARETKQAAYNGLC